MKAAIIFGPLLGTALVLALAPGGAGTSMQTAVTGEIIAFERKMGNERSIHLMFADGSVERRRFSDGETPAWSLDASKLAYSSVTIHSAPATGGSPTPLTSRAPNSGDYQPSWSPDGRRVAFTHVEGTNSDIFVVGADGQNLMRLTSAPRLEYFPAWSPDGTKIAFAAAYADGTSLGNAEIATMNPDGTGEQRLTTAPSADIAPDWSPDGSKIAFTAHRHSTPGTFSNAEIYVMNADGSGQRRITDSPGPDWLPRWSPDGKRLAFVTRRDGNDEIYVMNADGTGQANISRNPAEDSYPDWALTTDLGVSQSARPRKVRVGQVLAYTITVRNAGPGKATNVRVSNAVPRAKLLTYTAPGGRCSRASGKCTFSGLAAGAGARIRLRVRAKQPGRLTSKASVVSHQIDPGLKNNRSVLRTSVLRKKRLR
jgi:uncharacterized repeat protein (TIGR01451 family)